MTSEYGKAPAQATPKGTLLDQLMNPGVAKSEREWAAVAEITRLTAALEEAEKGPLTPKVIAELIRGKAARMGRLEEMQENTRFYSDGDWSVTPGNIPRPTKPCVVLRLTEDEAAAIRAMTDAYNG